MAEFSSRWQNFSPWGADIAVPEVPKGPSDTLDTPSGEGSEKKNLLDLPFPLGNGGLDPVEVARAERQNTRLGVTDPVDRRLNVLQWLYQHYREVGDGDMAGEVKAAYGSLRGNATDMARLVKMGDHDQDVLLKRLRDGHQWLTDQHRAWVEGNGGDDDSFQKGLDGWVELEKQLRDRHGYRQCIYGEGQRCPEDAPVRCDFCVKETRA